MKENENIPFVDLQSQYESIKAEIDSAISKVITESSFIKGKYVKEFENGYASSYEADHVVSCGNGTDALYIALKSLNIGPGDEVITTALSWISTSETITQSGAKVVFVDIDPVTFTINTEQIEEKITQNTKAIIPVHLYGHPANMSNIVEISRRHNIEIIEDCAQAHFAEWKEQRVGTFGIAGTFSFFPGKNLGAYGDAGCIITNNSKLADKMRMYANHGSLKKHEHEFEGINSRLDGLQAAILSVKLKYIKSWTELRIKHAAAYTKYLSEIDGITAPTIAENSKHVFHLFVVRSKKRDGLKSYLEKHNVSTGIHYPRALPFLRAYQYLNHKPEDFPVAHSYQSEILSLPIYPELREDSIIRVVNLIKNYFKK